MQKWRPLLLKIFFILLTIAIMAFNFNILRTTSQSVSQKEGHLDLSHYNFEEQGKLCLDGEWQFFHNQFLKPVAYSDLKAGEKPDVYITPPTVWNYYKINGESIPGFGYGTYRMIVTGVTPGEKLSLKVLPLSTAFRISIDDQIFAENGSVSKDASDAKVVYHPEDITFTPDSSEFVITVHISNYVYARGGMWDAPTLGTANQIKMLDLFIQNRDLFLLGCYFIMSLLCIVIFAKKTNQRAWFYFALLSVASAARVMIYGEHLISFLTENFRVITFIEYVTRYWYPLLLMLLLNEVLSGKIPRKLLKGFTLIIIAITIVTAFLPIHVYTYFARTVMIYDLMGGLIMCSLLFYPGQRFFIKNKNKAFLIYGIIALYVSGLYDMFFATTAYFEMTPIGFFIALLASAFILAIDYTEALNQCESAMKELEIECERKLQAEMSLLQSQIRPHFLYNALSAIANVCKKDGQKAERLILDLAYIMQASFDFSPFDKMVPLESELEYIHKYVEIEQARFGEKIRYTEQIEVSLFIQLPRLIIEPLVENSIRHGISKKKGGGEVNLRIYEIPQGIKIEVYDNGVGMSEEKKNEIFGEETKGVGLKNIHDRLLKSGGTGLVVESMQNDYTRISFTIKKEEGTC